MKKYLPICSCFVFFLLIVSKTNAAETIWQIGKEDSSYAEFLAAGDYPKAGERFQNEVRIAVGENAEQSFPWMIPGPVDDWAGSKTHQLEISFDLPDRDEKDVPAYRLLIRGIGQRAHPPVLQVEMVGDPRTKNFIHAQGGATGDRILETTDGAVWTTYHAVFLNKNLKEKGNVLKISNIQGSWFVFDSVRLETLSGKVETMTATPRRGILRGPGKHLLREIRLDFGGEVLVSPATFRLTEKDGLVSPIESEFDPKLPLRDFDVQFSISEDTVSKDLNLLLTLHQGENDPDPITTSVVCPGEKKWELHLIHQTHLDIGYTHTQKDVLERQVQSIRDALRYIEETRNYPEEAKFKFHPEGMWAVDVFLQEATDEEKAAFVRAAKNRDLHLDGMYAQAMSAMYNDEELFELFAGAFRFCRENEISLDSVMQTDVPGYTWGLVAAMAQNGIKYMTMGPNAGHRVGRLYELGDKPFWWVSPSGKERVLCWLHDTGYHQFHRKALGHEISEQEVFDLLDGKDWLPREREDERKFPFEDLAVVRYGIEGDNGRPNRALSDVVKNWNEKYAYPKLIISRNSDVMRLLEERYGDTLPEFRGDYTPYWEDGSASTTEATAINRRASERIVQAGFLWAMFDPKNYPKEDFDAAWTDLIMYDEHTWGAYNSISQPDSEFVKTQDDFKQEYARRGARRVDELIGRIGKESGDVKNGMILVNTLGRDRTGICFIGKAPRGDWKSGEVRQFKTAEGKIVPVQCVFDPDDDAAGNKTCSLYVDFGWGPDAPKISAFGAIRLDPVKVDENRSWSGGLFVDAETGEMGNDVFQLAVDKESGTIRSLKVKGIAQDLVAPGADGNRGLNDYLYIIGRNAEENRERIVGGVKWTVLAEGPLVASLLVETDPEKTPNAAALKRQITIFADTEKVRIVNVLDKKMERRPEGTFFGFPFNVPGGVWHVDTPWACVEVEKDQIPGANRNYYTVQRYCTLAGDQCGVNWVTVDANMVQFAPILFTKAWGLENWRKHFENEKPDGTLYSWVCNNHWETNYKAGQEGRLTFEYWIWPYAAKFDYGIAQNFARQVHQPVLRFQGDEKIPDGRILALGNERQVLLTGLRPARDGGGALIGRLFNPTNKRHATQITPVDPETKVYRSDTTERRGEELDRIELDPFEIISVRIESN